MSVISLSEAGGQSQKDSDDTSGSTFAIGICVSDKAINLAPLLETLKSEFSSPTRLINKIIVVASGCSREALSHVKMLARRDARILLLEESARKGKAEAINKIIELFNEDYLVFVNGDALPYPGSVEKLLRVITKDHSPSLSDHVGEP